MKGKGGKGKEEKRNEKKVTLICRGKGTKQKEKEIKFSL